MLHTGFQIRPGENQAPRQTLRHWPVLTAAVAAVAVIAAVFAVSGRAVPRLQRAARTRVIAEDVLPLPVQTHHALAAGVPPDLLKDKVIIARLAAASLTYTVRRGDTLSSIAKAQAGHASYWPELWWANRSHVHNPAALNAGAHLVMPAWHGVDAALLHKALAAIPKPPPPRRVSAPGAGGAVVVAAPAGSYSGAPGSFQACVIARESGGNPSAVNPSSGAGGLYQFLPSTWAALGFPGLPENASVAMQNEAFAKAYAESGAAPWGPYDGC